MRTRIGILAFVIGLTFLSGCGSGELTPKKRGVMGGPGVGLSTDMGPPLDPPGPQTLSLSADCTYDLGGVSGPVMYDAKSGKLYVSKVNSPKPAAKP